MFSLLRLCLSVSRAAHFTRLTRRLQRPGRGRLATVLRHFTPLELELGEAGLCVASDHPSYISTDRLLVLTMLPMLSLGVMVTGGFTAWFSGSISPW